jgi:hypothetical protein
MRSPYVCVGGERRQGENCSLRCYRDNHLPGSCYVIFHITYDLSTALYKFRARAIWYSHPITDAQTHPMVAYWYRYGIVRSCVAYPNPDLHVLGLLDPDPDPLVRGVDPAPDPDPS